MRSLLMVSQIADTQSHCRQEVDGHTNKGNQWDGLLIGERPVTEETTQTSGTTAKTTTTHNVRTSEFEKSQRDDVNCSTHMVVARIQ
jgi:hypothetical protein